MALNKNSLKFDGVDDRASIAATSSGPTIKGMKDWTIMAWVKPTAGNTQYNRLWVERQGTGTGIRLAITPFDGKIRFEYSPRDGVQDTNYDFKYNWDDYWHHIAFVVQQADGDSNYEMYLDATKVAEGQLVIPSNVHVDGSNNPIVTNTWPAGGKIYLGNASYHTSGGDVFASSTYWKGKVDDVILFNNAVPQGEITTYFSSYDIWDMGDTDMFSYWRFDDYAGSGSDTSTPDSDNAWTMTLSEGVNMWEIDRPYWGDGLTDTGNPTTPGSPSTTLVTSDGFTCNWTASTDNVYVQYYEVQLAQVSNFSTVLTTYNVGRDLLRKIQGLTPNTTYYWRVRAVDARSNVSSWTATQTQLTDTEGDVTPPNPPTNLAAPTVDLSFSSFKVTWTPSGSGDADGYKIDVSTSSSFSSYLSDYRNRDVGDVALFVVTGVRPLTTYYVRLRTYDTSGNESVASSILEVQTLAVPDTSDPLPVEMNPATGVSSKRATLNWEEGIDDVGVTHYMLDVAYNDTFSSFVTIGGTTYNNLNVGDVTSYPMINLTPNTGYYYRVRAYDSAGNSSENTEPAFFRTELSTVDEGGNISTILYTGRDAHVDSTAATTNFGTATDLVIAGSGAANTKRALIYFDLRNQLGTIVNAMLRVYITDPSASSIFFKVDNVTFTEGTVTWNTKPSVGGASLSAIPLTDETWLDIDISSLILDGPAEYTIEITMTANDTVTIASKEELFHMPNLLIESDPSTLTEVERELIFEDKEGLATNYIKNPRGQAAVTTDWTAIGSTPATLSAVTVSGRPALQAACSGAVSGQGMRYLVTDAPAVQGDFVYASVRARVTSGTPSVTMALYEYSAGGSLLATQTQALTASTTYQKIEIARTLTNIATQWVSVAIYNTSAVAMTIQTENWNLQKNDYFTLGDLPFFDGESNGAEWQSTVGLSRSTMPCALVKVESNYIGDGDQDNYVYPAFRRRRETDWMFLKQVRVNQMVHDHSLRRVTTYYGQMYLYNLLSNPSFEVNTTNWTLLNPNANASMVRDEDVSAMNLAYASSNASLKLTWGAGAGSGAYSEAVPVTVGAFYGARARILSDFAITMRLRIEWLDAASSVLSSTSAVAGRSERIGDETFLEFYTYGTAPASTVTARVKWTATSSTASTAWLDTVILSETSIAGEANPYRDGDSPDGFWIAAEHLSQTGIRVLPDIDYSFKHQYGDPDGVMNALEDGFLHLSDTHITSPISDNVTTLTDLTLIPTEDSIQVILSYTGDDNQNMTSSIRWRRSDLTGYTTIPGLYDRQSKTIKGVVSGLQSGTSYTIRIVASDAEGVYGGTGASNNVIVDTVTTLSTFNSAESESMIAFNGFVLMGREDRMIAVTEHDAFGLPNRRVQIEDLPRSHGAIELQNLWGKREITLKGFVAGDSRADLEDNKNTLKRALAPKKGRLVIDTLSTGQRYFIATCESFDTVEKGGENLRHLEWSAKFVCADPFSYDAEGSSIPEFTANDDSEIGVFNGGDVETDPLIMIRTTNSRAVTVTVINTVTGERITPDTTVLNNDRLVIDTAKMSVSKNGVEVDYSGSFPHLTAGSNMLLFQLESVLSSPSIKCTISWRDRYL